MSKFKYTCFECGKTNVQIRAWIDPNTDEVMDSDNLDRNDIWCGDCQDHVDLEVEEIDD